MLLVDLKSELEISVKVIPNQLSKFIESPNKNATIFPAMVLSSIDKGIPPFWAINLPRTIYIKEQFALVVPTSFSGKRNVPKRTTIFEEKLIAIRPELKKKYADVHNFDQILDSMIEEIISDKDLQNKIINLKENQLLSAFSKLLALKLLQETFKRLDEKDKINFKREALRGSKFG